MPAKTGPWILRAEGVSETGVSEERPKALAVRTGLVYPHHGYLAVGRDPRLAECLSTLAAARVKDDHEGLLWTICAAVWWLGRDQADELAGELARIIGP